MKPRYDQMLNVNTSPAIYKASVNYFYGKHRKINRFLPLIYKIAKKIEIGAFR